MTLPGPWIPDSPALEAAIAREALRYVGVCEDPPGSNRGPLIDDYLKLAGCPPGLYWCGAFVGWCFQKAGAKVPPIDTKKGTGPASCDEWMRWAKEHQLFTSTPQVGYAVLYGAGEDAQHAGILVRRTPHLLTVEGNRGLVADTNNGELVDLGPLATRRLLGYVRPVAA